MPDCKSIRIFQFSLEIICLTVFGLSFAGQAHAQVGFPQTDFAQTSYYDVGTSLYASASGWGGPGFSGGAGDELLRIINPNAHGDEEVPGWLCAMTYVFDDLEEMQACCGCPVSADQVLTMSVINDLTGNAAVRGANRIAGTINILSADFNYQSSPNQPTPPGVFGYCNPGAPFELDPSLHASISHTETMAPIFPSTQFTSSTMVENFQTYTVGDAEVDDLVNGCNAIQTNFSGAGACNCPVPVPPPPPPPHQYDITLLGCQNKDNTTLGGNSITLTAPTGVEEYDLVIVNVDYIATGAGGDPTDMSTVTVTPPPKFVGNDPSCDGICGGVVSSKSSLNSPSTLGEVFYWHAIQANEVGTPNFTFTFSGNVRAEGGILAYRHTCLDDADTAGNAIPCAATSGDPVWDSGTGRTAGPSNTVSTGNLSASDLPQAGAGNGVPAHGYIVAGFNTDQSDIVIPEGGGKPPVMGPLMLECTASVNAGLTMADLEHEDGGPVTNIPPYTASLFGSQQGWNIGEVLTLIPQTAP